MKPTPLLLTCLIALAFPMAGLAQPTITTQPKSQSVSLGATATFQISAGSTVPPLSYQWRFNEAELVGATNRSLVLTNIQSPHAGDYAVAVTDASGSVTSRAARLDVDPTFTKVTTGSIVTDRNTFESCAWGDFDGDGFLDLAVEAGSFGNIAVPFAPIHLYHNNGPGPDGFTFTRVTNGPIATLLISGSGLAWADYDNDGHLDLFAGNSNVRNVLFRNNGDGTLTKTTNAPVTTTDGSTPNDAGWADYNNDGLLDLFVANVNKPNQFYRNNGDGTFRQMTTNDVGLILKDTGVMANVSWADYDDDGDLDLLIGRLHSPETSLFYRNNGKGTFTSLSKQMVGDLVIGDGAKGFAWGDYDNDGDLDLFDARGFFSGAPANFLWRNNGNGMFTKMSSNDVGIIVGEPVTSLSCAWADYDNDGWLDMFVSNVGPNLAGANNLLYHNNGDGTFTKVTTGSPVNDGGNSWGLAWGDFDNDGFMDLFVCNGTAGVASQNFLYRNNRNTNHWLKLNLVGTVSNRSAIGAKVRVKATVQGKTVWQRREISGSSNRHSFQDMRPNFGLGDATVAETVRIEWPSGIVQELQKVAANQILTVTEPARLQVVGLGAFRVQSWKGMAFEVWASTDLKLWSPLTTVTNLTGTLDFTDPTAANHLRHFYRAVLR